MTENNVTNVILLFRQFLRLEDCILGRGCKLAKNHQSLTIGGKMKMIHTTYLNSLFVLES